jgi:hypothetical protein
MFTSVVYEIEKVWNALDFPLLISRFFQVQNFLRFCELASKKCSELKEIHLTTCLEPHQIKDQQDWLALLKNSLQSSRNVLLVVKYSETLHDREIRLNNGWVIKIGRGLDYFKPPESKFALGYFDQDLRPCRETVVDISHEANIRSS